MNEQKKEITKTPDKMSVEFVPFGATDKIKLTAAMIRSFVAVPTKSGALPSERDCVKFLMLCRGKRANPFEGDCFLIGYDSQNGPTFSLVCGIELFLKRAEHSEDYDGCQYGVIVDTADGIKEREGAIVYKNETLEGGWAKVYRKNHNRPVYKAVKFSTYDTGRSRWEKDPGGQISKVALSQALRESYPTAIGGLYTQEEMQKVTESGENAMQIKEPIAMPEEIAAEPVQSLLDQTPSQQVPPHQGDIISEPQSKRFYAMAKTAGKTEDEIKGILQLFGFQSSKEITKDQYNAICEEVSKPREPGQD
jgi:phage recombination protein Bet